MSSRCGASCHSTHFQQHTFNLGPPMAKWYIGPNIMTAHGLFAPTHRAIRNYCEQVAALRDRRVLNEMSVRWESGSRPTDKVAGCEPPVLRESAIT